VEQSQQQQLTTAVPSSPYIVFCSEPLTAEHQQQQQSLYSLPEYRYRAGILYSGVEVEGRNNSNAGHNCAVALISGEGGRHCLPNNSDNGRHCVTNNSDNGRHCLNNDSDNVGHYINNNSSDPLRHCLNNNIDQSHCGDLNCAGYPYLAAGDSAANDYSRSDGGDRGNYPLRCYPIPPRRSLLVSGIL
jgi:hypothetical protein